jgi:ABC-type Fe3+/spermidine/putrescine transport system ATPase subunit
MGTASVTGWHLGIVSLVNIRPLLKLDALTKSFGAVTAVQPTSIDIDKGEFFALLGPSGCGKTTLLRMVGGFTSPTSGRIIIEGEDVTNLGPERRPVNTVFQGYGLFPHMSVRQNIGYGLKRQKTPSDEIEDRVEDVITLVRMGEFSKRAIDELSGGQQQRVALARALVMRPKILLLDEPLSALDLKLRQQMQRELRRIHDEIGGTFIVVTHDQNEALSLADNVAVMRRGGIEQIGGPSEVYDEPANQFVSTFIGEANLLPGRRQNGTVALETGQSWSSEGADGELVCMIRPEYIRCIAADTEADISVNAKLISRTYQGPTALLEFVTSFGSDLRVVENRSAGIIAGKVGAEVLLGWSKTDLRFFQVGDVK